MKKSTLSLSLVLAASALGCSKANFWSEGKRRGGEILDGMHNPDKEPVDLSKLDKNQDQTGKPIGPIGGDSGEVVHKTIELTCDNSNGVEVDLGEIPDSEKPILRLLGDKSDSGKKGTDVKIGVDGKPVDGTEPGIGGGKITDPIPLPPIPPIETPKRAKVIATVKGEFCPVSNNSLTVLFVIDHSGSMGAHWPKMQGDPVVPGSDPQTGGSCGRLRAAQAILSKLQSERKPGDHIQIGLVPFAGGIVLGKVMPILEIDQFAALVNKDSFCQYVVQHPSFGYDPINPGGIQGVGIDASTNYTAAFTAAETLLSRAYGRKVVYFVSDGEPTSGGADPVQAGIEAGRRLRNNVDNLTLNAILLGNYGPWAQRVLEEVAGSPERVRRAENADQLADRILEFPEASINEQSGDATLTVHPYPREHLGLRYLVKDGSRPAVWIYETQPFVLLGVPGEMVENRVDVTAEGNEGSTYHAIARIFYRQ